MLRGETVDSLSPTPGRLGTDPRRETRFHPTERDPFSVLTTLFYPAKLCLFTTVRYHEIQ